jgi:putative transposase
MLTQSKKTEERQWLKEVLSVLLQESIRHLDVAYQNFFKSRTGKHKGKKFGLPKFKKKINPQSAEFTKTGFSLSANYVYLAKIGSIKPIWSINLPSAPSSVTSEFQRWYPPRDLSVESIQNLKSKILNPTHLSVGSI